MAASSQIDRTAELAPSLEPAAVVDIPLETSHRLAALEAQIARLGSLMVAYSGGVDSAFLAATAFRVLGSRMLAVLADSPSLARRDLEQARAFADSLQMPLRVVETSELERPEYQRNDANRCFHCKDELFAVMEALGSELGFEHIAYGMNADDTRDYRPGQRAAEQHAVLAPLADAGLTKLDVRTLAKAAGYPLWDRPAAPCFHRGSSMAAPLPAKFSSRSSAPKRACASWAFASSASAITATWPASRFPGPSCRVLSPSTRSTPSPPLSNRLDTSTSRSIAPDSAPAR